MFHVQNNEISTDKGDGKKEEENKMKQKMERKKKQLFIRLHGPCTDGDSGKFGIKLCAPCQHKRYMLRCVCFFFLWKKLSSSLLLVDEMRTIGLGRFRCFIFLYIDRCSMLISCSVLTALTTLRFYGPGLCIRWIFCCHMSVRTKSASIAICVFG